MSEPIRLDERAVVSYTIRDLTRPGATEVMTQAALMSKMASELHRVSGLMVQLGATLAELSRAVERVEEALREVRDDT